MTRSPAGGPGHALAARGRTGARRRELPAAAAMALVLVLAIGAAVAAIGARHPAGRPAALPPAAASTSGEKWLTGHAGRLLRAVYADLGRLSASTRAAQGRGARAAGPGAPAPATAAGPRLAADAAAALSGPMPPVDARAYRAALRTFEKAGRLAAGGEFSKADKLLGAGGNDITKVTAAVNNPAKVQAPAAVNEPAGQ